MPADPAMLVEHQVKTELGDYRGFYANVRDAVLGTAPLAVTAGRRLSRNQTAGDGARKLGQGLHAARWQF